MEYKIEKRHDELYHYGVLGMKWGVRCYQNKDGTLTDKGRQRLRLEKFDNEHNTDIVLNKGTKASRVVSTPDYEYLSDPNIGGSVAKGQKYIKEVLDKDMGLDSKYLSIDGVRNSGRANGKEYYVSWFTNEGYDPDNAYVTTYILKNDVRIASGKKVVDAVLDEIGSKAVRSLIKDNKTSKSITLDYTKNIDLFDKVNKKFKDMGYDGIEDINDLDTDMPIILFDSKKNAVRDSRVQSGREAIDDIIKAYRKRQ